MNLRPYRFVPGKITNERQALLKEFVDAINLEREGTVFKPVTGRAVAIKVSHLTLKELYEFLSNCRDYKNRKGSFARCFFGALK